MDGTRHVMGHRLLLLIFLVCARLLAQVPPGAGWGEACGCLDGRTFRVGAAVFGQNSTRVLITGWTATNTASAPLPLCRHLSVAGQTIRERTDSDGRLYLKREMAKRGTLREICATNIHFSQPGNRYTFFTDDWTPIVPSREASKAKPSTVTPDEGDLAGKDLIRLIRPVEQGTTPADVGFSERAIKEGAYVILSRKVVADSVEEGSNAAPPSSSIPKAYTTVPAGTMGRVQQRGGFRGGSLWVVDMHPESQPRPFWRALFPIRQRAKASRRIVLREEQFVEINYFLDQFGVETTRFRATSGDEVDETAYETTLSTYAPRRLPLRDNLTTALDERVDERILEAARKMELRVRPGQTIAAGKILVLEEPDTGVRVTTPHPDLFRQQCFFRTEGLAAADAVFRAVAADLRVLDATGLPQAPADYYAIDLYWDLQTEEFQIGSLVCRFPWTRIDVGLVAAAQRILGTVFETLSGPRKR